MLTKNQWREIVRNRPPGAFKILTIMVLFAAVVLLSGCLTLEEQRQIEDTYRFRYYTRAEVDAINAAIVCREQARNLVQIARCNR